MSSQVLLSGSHREHPVDSIFVGEPALDEIIQVTLVLKHRNPPEPDSLNGHLSSEELAHLHGAHAADIQAFEAFASQHHLCVAGIHPAARSVVLTGPLFNYGGCFRDDS
jgi:hypothetical protein